MNKFLKCIQYVGIAVITLFWLYVAARMITRGILRSLKEWRKRDG